LKINRLDDNTVLHIYYSCFPPALGVQRLPHMPNFLWLACQNLQLVFS